MYSTSRKNKLKASVLNFVIYLTKTKIAFFKLTKLFIFHTTCNAIIIVAATIDKTHKLLPNEYIVE